MTCEQILGLILLGLAALLGIGLMIDDRGGWKLLWAEVNRKRRAKK